MKLKLITGLCLLTILVSCHPHTEKDPTAFADEVSANGTVGRIRVVKSATNRGNGWVVFQNYSNGLYTAVNLDGQDGSQSPAEYYSTHAIGVRSTCDGKFEDGNGNIYEATAASAKDLEKAASSVEKLQVEMKAELLSSKFGLSEERSLEVARYVQQYQKVSRTRVLSEKENDTFAKRIFGLSAKNVQEMVIAQATGADHEKETQALFEKAADFNGISPEDLKEGIIGLLKK